MTCVKVAAGMYCEKTKKEKANLYRIEGTDKTALFDIGDVTDEFMKNVDILILNNCMPERIMHIKRLLNFNPDIVLMGTTVTLNFTEEFLGIKLNRKRIRYRESIDLGGKTLELMPVFNVNRSKHQDRTWKKKYKFLQMPNWQWLDSIYALIKEEILISGQLFSSINNNRELYFKEKLRPFGDYVRKNLEQLEEENITTILPEQGEQIEYKIAAEEYIQWLNKSNDGGSEKLAVIPYVSEFGYTEMLAKAISSGIEQVPGIKTQMVKVKTGANDEILEKIERASGVVIGVPTREGDAANEILHLLADMTTSMCEGKVAAAFGSYSYEEKGVSNTMCRMNQLNMQTVKKGFSVKFKPDSEDLKAAERFGIYFGKCIAAGEILIASDCVDSELIEPIQTERKFIIIGNGASGTAAAEEIRKLDSGCKIKLISREPYKAYNRQMITKGLLKEIPSKNMFLHEEEWYRERNIESVLSKEVVDIDSDLKQIIFADGTAGTYDKLILATGAKAKSANVKDSIPQGVFKIRDLSEMDRIRAYIKENNVKDVTILGGGIMALETAADLDKGNFNITIIEKAPHLMAKQIDEKAGRLITEKLIEAGINVITSESVCEFLGNDKVTGLRMESGKEHKTQLVLQCLGIEENSNLLNSIHGGIKVNEKMETGIPDIFACGDCAVYNGENYGLWTQAVEMARVAAANAVGKYTRYKQVVPAVTFVNFGISLFAVGDVGNVSDNTYESKEVYDPAAGVYKKLYFRNHIFCGGILLGDVDSATELIQAYEMKMGFESKLIYI